MPNPHIIVDTNEIRMTDDDGAPSLHVMRPTYLDKERYYWFPMIEVARTKQGVTNSSVLVAHTELTLPLQAGALYQLDGFIEWDATGTIAQQMNLSAPSGSTGTWSASEFISGAGTCNGVAPTAIGTPADGLNGMGGSAVMHWHLKGWVRTGGTAGNITVEFARDSGGVANQTIYIVPGSWIRVQRVA